MKLRSVSTIIISLFLLYTAITCAPDKQPTNMASEKSDSLSLCSTHSGFFQLPNSLALPRADKIPGYGNQDSMIAFLQNEADSFSWRTFIALNWPATATGAPDSSLCFTANHENTNIWLTWMPGGEMFKAKDQVPTSWPENARASTRLDGGLEVHELRTSKIDSEFSIFDADQLPVVDSRHMYTLYENFYNRSAYEYIVKGKLYNKEGQRSFSSAWPSLTKGLVWMKGQDTINIARFFKRAYFSVGNAKDSTETTNKLFQGDSTTYTLHFKTDPGAMIIKSAWVVLVPGKDDTSKYLTRTISAKTRRNGDGSKKYLLGLVGMHIMHKVAEQTQWVWSSFEHINNAPLLDSNGLAALAPDTDYLYFDKTKNDSALYNKAPGAVFESNPYKRMPTQLVQLRGPQKSTDSINSYFHDLIRRSNQTSKWLNYRLIGTQWAFTPSLFTTGLHIQPAFLANPVLEAYVQPTSSCMGCHQKARFLGDKKTIGYNADDVWELANVE